MTQNNRSDADEISPATQHPHTPADDREEIYYEGSPMLRGELGFFLMWTIIGALLITSPFIYRSLKGFWPPGLVSILMMILGVVAILVPVVRMRTVRYRISNYRIDYER